MSDEKIRSPLFSLGDEIEVVGRHLRDLEYERDALYAALAKVLAATAPGVKQEVGYNDTSDRPTWTHPNSKVTEALKFLNRSAERNKRMLAAVEDVRP